MERDINLKKIAAYFSRISSEVKMLNCLGLYDINKISETICIPLLKEIYSLPNLKNLNATQDNFPAIDLACDQSKKSFQITSTSSSAKILNTLTKYKKYGLDKIYINVKVFILTEKQKSYTSKQLIQIAKETNFNIQDDIIDFSSLLVIIEREHDATLSGIILDILDSEFKKIDKFTIIRDKLDGLQERTLEKISNEIKTKKYIPNVYCEPVHVKNKARIFSNPLFFHRKIFR
ncbi:SMEK domain-containing protein, partial [Shewanella sp. Bg11-22]